MSTKSKSATCQYCKQKFDRNKIPFIIVTKGKSPRYIHASCAKEYAEKTKKVLDAPIDPSLEYKCEYCCLGITKGEEIELPGDMYAHKECYKKETGKDKSDKDKLFDYIMIVYNESFVDPAKQKSIQKMMNEFNFTYSGIHGTLTYLYEILRKKPTDSNYLGIVPYYYTEAKNYYIKLEKSRAANAKKNIENYKPKQIKVIAQERKREPIKKVKFSVLDEE